MIPITLNRLETWRWLDDLKFRAETKAQALSLIEKQEAITVKVYGHPGVLAGGSMTLATITRRDLDASRRRRKRRWRDGYPLNWPTIRLGILRRAGYRCEKCGVGNGDVHPVTGKVVRLQVSHQNHVKSDCRDENLRALCARCHGLYDGKHKSELYWRRKVAYLSQ